MKIYRSTGSAQNIRLAFVAACPDRMSTCTLIPQKANWKRQNTSQFRLHIWSERTAASSTRWMSASNEFSAKRSNLLDYLHHQGPIINCLPRSHWKETAATQGSLPYKRRTSHSTGTSLTAHHVDSQQVVGMHRIQCGRPSSNTGTIHDQGEGNRTCTMSSSCRMWSFPTRCGRCLLDTPQTSACLKLRMMALWILLQNCSTVHLPCERMTGSEKSGSLPLGLVYTLQVDAVP